ncbi:hypothetical protein LSUB1_G007432 [Lachnellula subtilissima]|uniref:BTB domain-containing protein n=1 Tax=Lachnellula subtilissima TaxID=602034 RepID=A0A8H8U925_9HELO|nr:hypothetical protein LSUB1_G007432 [Lachnellula subtilissima]
MMPPRRRTAPGVSIISRRPIRPRGPSTPVAASTPVMTPVSPAASPSILVKLKLNMKGKPKQNGPNFSSGSGHQVVTILAGSGEKEEKFIVHKQFACHYSPLFKAAFESGFIEGQTQTYKLDDVEPKFVQVLLHWLYTQKLDIEVAMEQDSQHFLHLEEPFILAVSLWALADKLLLPGLQNEVVDWINHVCREEGYAPTHCLKQFYDCTGAGSLLRKLFISQTAHYMPSNWYTTEAKHFPQDFLVDLAEYFSTEFVAKHTCEARETFYISAGMISKAGKDYYVQIKENRDGVGSLEDNTLMS